MRKTSILASAALALLALSSLAPAASAAETTSDEVPVSIRPGALTVQVSSLPSFAGSVPTVGNSTDLASRQKIRVSDQRGSAAGYQVTQSITEVTYKGSTPQNQGDPLEPKHFNVTYDLGRVSLDSAPAPQSSWPVFVPNLYLGNLEAGQTVITAVAGTGMGSYEFSFGMGLDTPPRVLAGDYSAVLTTSVVSGNL